MPSTAARVRFRWMVGLSEISLSLIMLSRITICDGSSRLVSMIASRYRLRKLARKISETSGDRMRVARLPIVLAYTAFVMIGVKAGAVGVLLPEQIADYGVDKATIGIMFF